MADIKCPRCHEPWDMDELHEVVAEGDFASFDEAYKAFRNLGCGKVFGVRSCVSQDQDPTLAALAELLGDDVDGYASLCEDFAL